MRQKKYLLCFHDLHALNAAAMLPVLKQLQNYAGAPFSLLIVPAIEGATKEQEQNFSEILRQLHADGFELVLHGYKHRADLQLNRSLLGKRVLRLTNYEAEFAGLNEIDSLKIVNNAVESFRKKFNIDNVNILEAFVPPTWYSNPFLKKQILQKNCLYESRLFLSRPNKRSVFSPVTSFAGIPSWLENVALKFGEWILNVPTGVPRLALHPIDFPHLEKQILKLIQTASEKRRLIYYKDLR